MKKRIDVLLLEKELVKSRNSGSELIKSGRITADGKAVNKSSEQIDEMAEIKITGDELPYVGRGGLKLKGALTKFKIDPKNLVALDVGASTGGFTECLLRQGAKKVYAVDVGTDQLDPKIKEDSRVISLEQTDIRKIENFPEIPELAVIDVSFISLELILEKVKSLIGPKGKIIALVKPQFETDQKEKNKSGVVRNSNLQTEALEKIKRFSKNIGLKVLKEIDSPITGSSGNKEYFLLLQK